MIKRSLRVLLSWIVLFFIRSEGFRSSHPFRSLVTRHSSAPVAIRSSSSSSEEEESYNDASPPSRRPSPSRPSVSRNDEWLRQATETLLSSDPGTLHTGTWHQVVSMIYAWSALSKSVPEAPVRMEALLKRLLQEQEVGNNQVVVDISLYNAILDAWACAALFGTRPRDQATLRAREILVLLQETFEQTKDENLQPNAKSFDVVLHVVCKTERVLMTRRLLAWMEHLSKSGKNEYAQPTKSHYIWVLDAYANSGDGPLAEGFLRHLRATGQPIDTLCYNIAIKAWRKRGRESAEHADRILEEMDAPKDLVTYTSVISAWAHSGMRAHAVTRAEELLREIENDNTLQLTTVVLNAVMSTWVKSRTPAAVERTHEILEQMQDAGPAPDLFSYNTHLHALSLHSGKSTEHAPRALAILDKMEAEDEVCPNLFSYNLVIDAYCKSPDPKATLKAAKVLRRLVQHDRLQPDSFSFNQVLSALSKSSLEGSTKMAQELLTYMTDAYESGALPNAKPDLIGYTSVIMAYSRSNEPRATEKAERLFHQLQSRYYSSQDKDLKPNRVVYNALIDCWAKSGQGTLGARKAESLLGEMQRLYQAGDEKMAPNAVTYNALLNAWARSGTRCCGIKAEYYLDRMWELYMAGDEKVKPNDRSYNTVINAISKSKNEGKAQKALRILRRMDKLYRAGNKEARPNEVTYTAVLNSCAFPAVRDQKTRRKALDTAIFTLEELQSSRYGQPNQITYGTFLKACANLLPDDDDMRRVVIERTFQQCCKDGQVGEMVLAYLRQAAPDDLYKELLADSVRSSGPSISVEDLPPEWRCNVRDKDRWKEKPYYRRTHLSRKRSGSRSNTERLKP